MKSLSTALLFLAFALVARADQALQYEPALVEITGVIGKAKAQHPNESWFDFQFIKLATPASIQGDNVKDSFNETETGVTEIQIYSGDEKIRKQYLKLVGKKATLKGTVFHAQTAWHVRQLVLAVTEVKAAK